MLVSSSSSRLVSELVCFGHWSRVCRRAERSPVVSVRMWPKAATCNLSIARRSRAPQLSLSAKRVRHQFERRTAGLLPRWNSGGLGGPFSAESRLALGQFAVAADVSVLAADDHVDGVFGVAEVVQLADGRGIYPGQPAGL